MEKNCAGKPGSPDGKPLLQPGVSVVLCCYNSAGVIVPTIQALAAQDVCPGAGYEVILVDNNCTDETVVLAESSWGDPAHPLRIVKEHEPGLINARKTGVKSARYEILLFVDDDLILPYNWAATIYRLYKKAASAGVIGGTISPLFQGEKPWWFDRFAQVYACGVQKPSSGSPADKKTLPGAGLSFRTAVIQEIFDAAVPLFLVGRTQDTLSRGEDSELCLRAALMGWDVRQESTLVLQHYLLARRLSWEYVLQAKKGGGAAAVILKMYKKLVQHEAPLTYEELSADLERKWRYFWKKIENEAELKEEGSLKAFRYSYLQGFTEKLKSMGAETYDRVREQLTGFYSQAT
jgi:glycosyltransferase involved in cell wall biosynthesis